jgi:hypothetical protein
MYVAHVALSQALVHLRRLREVTAADDASAEEAADALLLTAEAHLLMLDTCSLQKDVEVRGAEGLRLQRLGGCTRLGRGHELRFEVRRGIGLAQAHLAAAKEWLEGALASARSSGARCRCVLTPPPSMVCLTTLCLPLCLPHCSLPLTVSPSGSCAHWRS